jgi:FkbM family methyltransferase
VPGDPLLANESADLSKNPCRCRDRLVTQRSNDSASKLDANPLARRCPWREQYHRHVDLYNQDAELALLSKIVTRLKHRSAIDVGAERGGISAGMLQAGLDNLFAFEPHPTNADALRARFADDERVTVHECAVSDSDGDGELRVSTRPGGGTLRFGHTLLKPLDTPEIAWTDSVTVTRRSLQSLLDAGELPERVGILKIDTEGHDLAVVQGMGSLKADIVMVEHWTDLPQGLGRCPWTTREMVQALGPHGFAHFAFFVHRDDLVTLKWDDGDVERGAMGNLVFIHDYVLSNVLPDLLECCATLAERTVAVAQDYRAVASDRLTIIHDLEKVAGDRLKLVHELEETAEARLHNLEVTTEQLRKRNTELDELRFHHSAEGS